MKNWINRNNRVLIISTFLIPIIIVALVSISHVTVWYNISNPNTWAIYLSVGIEIAALSALAAISVNMGRKVYFPFFIVTLIQFIGNIFFAYQYINIDSKLFKDWVDLVTPLLSLMGVEEGDVVGHKRFLALFSGGILPIISLSFLHMLVKFSENNEITNNDIISLEEEKKKWQQEFYEKIKLDSIDSKDVISEVSKVRLSEDDLKKLENILLNPPVPNEDLKSAAYDYQNTISNENNDDGIVNELYQESEDENIVDSNPNNFDDELNHIIDLQLDMVPKTFDSDNEEVIIIDNQDINDVIEVVEQKVETTIPIEQPTLINNSVNNKVEEKKNL